MKNFRNNVEQIWGQAGKIWLAQLPELVRKLAMQWNLRHLQPVANLTYNYVLSGYRHDDNAPVILKLSFETLTFQHEIAALTAYRGHGSVLLLEADSTLNAMLLEWAMPGRSLASLFPHHDSMAVQHAVEVMNRLHTASIQDPTHFHHISDWLAALDSTHPSLPPYHRDKAQQLAQDLLQSSGPAVLLHGDLHHDNMVASTRDQWLSIDPKGVIGERAYEVGAFIRNPIPGLLQQPDVSRIIARRLDMFAELLDIDRQRLKEWSYVQAILADCWAAPYHDDTSDWLAKAIIIDKL